MPDNTLSSINGIYNKINISRDLAYGSVSVNSLVLHYKSKLNP